MDSIGHYLVVFFLTVVPVVIYVVPSLVAFGRQHHHRWPIAALNIALGWTMIAWLAALVWALGRVNKE